MIHTVNVQDIEYHGGSVIGVVIHHGELLQLLVSEVRALHERDAEMAGEITALREQLAALTRKVNEIPAPVVAKPPPPPPVNVTHVAPAHEMRLHFKGETTVQITSQTPDGVRLVKFLLE